MLLRFENYWAYSLGVRVVLAAVGHQGEVRLPAATHVDRTDDLDRLTAEMAANAAVSARTAPMRRCDGCAN